MLNSSDRIEFISNENYYKYSKEGYLNELNEEKSNRIVNLKKVIYIHKKWIDRLEDVLDSFITQSKDLIDEKENREIENF